jgi:5-methylthioadenosine/S-adenosylhomocysteine deaminase
MHDQNPILIENGKVLELDRDPHQPRVVDILIENGVIAEIRKRGGQQQSSSPARTASADVIDAAGKLIVPGFINAHYHSHDVFLKGCFDPSVLEFWVLNALPRAYPSRSDAEVRLRTLLGAIECIRGGITTVQDMLTLSPLTAHQVDVVSRAYREAGLRVILGLQVANVSPLDTTPFWREVIPKELQTDLFGPPPPPAGDPLSVMEEIFRTSESDGMRRFAVSPSSPERCTRALLEGLSDLADRFALPVYSHIYISRAEVVNARRTFSAHGGSLVAYLDAIGLLSSKLTLAHGVWLNDAEILTLAENGVSVVLNLLSNLKTKNGVAPIRRLLEAGVNIALGCDNCSCSDAQNIFQAMKLFTLLAAVSDPREGPPDAIDAIRAATVGGARTAGIAEEIGAIRVGMRADLVVLDAADPVYVPLNSAARQLVYGEGGRGVETVIIDGRIVMRNRKILTLDEVALRAELDDTMVRFRHDAEVVMARTGKLRRYITDADDLIWRQDVGLSRYVGL